MTGKTQESSLRVITGEAKLSYPHILTAQKGDQGKKDKFSGTLIFAPGSNLDALKAAVLQAGEAKWPGKFSEMVRLGQVRLPFRTDWEAKNYPENSVFINCRSDNRPGLAYPYASKEDPTKPEKVPLDKVQETFYAGAIVRASVTAFGYDNSGNKGVSFALNNLQFIRDGERLDNRVQADAEFKVDLSAAPPALADILKIG